MTFPAGPQPGVSATADLIKKEYSNPGAGGTPELGESREPLPGKEPGQEPGGTPENGVVKLQELFGDTVKTPEELKNHVTRGILFTPEVETELGDLRKRKTDFDTLTEMEEKLKTFNPYKNPNYYRLEKIAETRPDDIGFYQQIILGNVNEVEMIKADFMRKHPDLFKDHPEDLQSALENEFPHYFDEAFPPDSKEFKADQMKLKMRASEIKKSYLDEFNAIPIPDPKAELDKKSAALEDLKTAWIPKIGGIKKDLNKIPVMVTDEKEENEQHYFDIDIPEKDKDEMIAYAQKYVVQNQIPITDENIAAIREHVQTLWIVKNLAKYTAAVADNSVTAINGEWRKNVHNSRKPGESGAPAGTPEDGQQSLFNHLMSKRQVFRF